MENQQLKAIYTPKNIYLDDLKGIERQKEKIIQNTLQFLNGLPANDVLLTGSRGTGKSFYCSCFTSRSMHLKDYV
ncbi:DUF815 domain-containing protein [Acinetobacter baumannii]